MNRDIRRQHARCWVATIPNYDDEKLKTIKEFAEKHCPYAVIGEEVAPSTGTKHLQCYFRFWTQMRGNVLLDMGITHIEVARGTEEQNRNYCIKEGKFIEIGQMKMTKKQEKEEYFKGVIECFNSKGLNEFVEVYPKEALIYGEKLERLRSNLMVNKEPWNGQLQDKNFWIWGAPGTGKSQWARSHCAQEKIYLKPINKWWNGFIRGVHKIILFEDFPDDAKYMAQLMKVWSDRYTFTAELKGSSILIDPGEWYLIVTSNYSMDECFNGTDAVALKRRFREVNIKSNVDLFLDSELNFELLQSNE
nr:MAG: replication-associated protein [Canine circovirus]